MADVLASKIKKNSKNTISAFFSVISVAGIVASMVFCGVKLAYNVKFNNKVIMTVSNKKVYYAAIDMVAQIVEGEDVISHLPEAQINTVVTVNDAVDDCAEVVDAIIDNTDEIVSASRLVIDGVNVGFADTSVLESALSARKAIYNVDSAECESEFINDVKFEQGYFLKSELSDISALADRISSLKVKTTVKEVTTQSIPYKTVTKKTAEKPAGYVNTDTKGECGVSVVTSGVIYINGEQTDKTTLSTEVLKQPVDEVITVGVATSGGKAISSGFKFPLPSGTWEISCPYGKGGHKGVDLRAPKGTAIMATASGTVTLAQRYVDYGNCVIIDHGNGISTLYAHASALCVRVGDTVSAGDIIALVGSTGNSTGNHLHFEVHIGGNRVNPQPYIGLR